MKPMRTFASDNYSTVHPDVMGFLLAINQSGHDAAYGDDAITTQAKDLLRTVLGRSAEILFVSTGTAANILSLRLLLERPYDALITSDVSHVFEEEAGALSAITGAHIFTVPHVQGKITAAVIEKEVEFRTSLEFHSALPKVVSIASTTEYGTYYTIGEIKEIAAYCHANDMYLHVDGCRLANAIAAIGCTLAEYVQDVDILSFGGAKNGLMNAEAIAVFNSPSLDLRRIQKQSLQLVSKMRYVAGQFIPYLTDDLWLKNAHHANDLASYFSSQLKTELRGEVIFTQETMSNQIFCQLPEASAARLRDRGYKFYDWNSKGEVRFVVSWDNTKKDIDDLLAVLMEPQR